MNEFIDEIILLTHPIINSYEQLFIKNTEQSVEEMEEFASQLEFTIQTLILFFQSENIELLKFDEPKYLEIIIETQYYLQLIKYLPSKNDFLIIFFAMKNTSIYVFFFAKKIIRKSFFLYLNYNFCEDLF